MKEVLTSLIVVIVHNKCMYQISTLHTLNLHRVICNWMSVNLGKWLRERFCKTRFRTQDDFF